MNADEFRLTARAWLEQHFPPALKGVSFLRLTEGPIRSDPDYDRWRRELGDIGWSAPEWPRQYGGGGLTPEQARILREEMSRLGAANPIAAMMGARMLAPTLLEFGTEAQKREHLPPIVRGEQRWCQGYSEPGAGSDLASLRTQAIDQGDHYLVNGQKIWTSGAQHADWCFCLVRTDNTRKHDGISFLLIDMRSPGIEVRPIRLISGDSPFCETFFTDVRVPKANLVGRENGGWTVGKRLLQFERQGVGGAPLNRQGDPRPLQDLAKHYLGVDEHGRLRDPELRVALTRHLMQQQAYTLTVERVAAQASVSRGPSAITSITKNARTRIGQDRAELMIRIMGYRGLGWEGDGFAANELEAVRAWLSGKATTIYAGSYEIQNNVIAKQILGLPDPR
jgi:alkylation response protein AidB-like acyl-CoA dehydrogenase